MILAAMTFAITTSTFKPNGSMPKSTVYNSSGCTGANHSPELRWQGAPAGTRSFAIIMHDPDAPAPGGWYHWVAYNLPATMHDLAEGATLPDSELGTTSFGDHPYGGPCPPPGKPHHYNTTIYALDVVKVASRHLTGPQLQAAIAHHTLARATVTGLYAQH